MENNAQIGVTYKKDINCADWYTDVLKKSNMMDYYQGVSGCYILRPWSYCIWEEIQHWLDIKFKNLGVQNAYFPMFISNSDLEKEKEHIAGFSPEVAWVTRAGKKDLNEPLAIRPTSETVIYPFFSDWIKSHRDLPLKVNQWNNVVRWEFKNPQPFLRAREFLWQEGHTAHLTKEEADIEVCQILDLYRRVYEELFAVPVIPGIKSEKEKFAGSLYTATVEGFIPTTGRGIQAATAHCLGQNFSKMFEIEVQNTKGEKSFVWQNSWGLSTRSIGVMVMVHGDDKGLVLPPRVASLQAVIVPCGINKTTSEGQKLAIYNACEELSQTLKNTGVKSKADLREGYNPGFKFNDWELKGDLGKKQTLVVRRDTGVKQSILLEEITTTIPDLLETIQNEMFRRAKATLDSRVIEATTWDEIIPALDSKCIVAIPWCEVESCEDDIKERSGIVTEPVDEKGPSAGAKSLAIPFDQSKWTRIVPGKTKCPACGKDAKCWTLFGRSY
ncbi:hypothetical protein BDQ17DRAFT_1392452 [Cyathus striatus]|nr:hypothetical protein BDQ17DRAFT_1392452 [Cyathus striatus]